MTFERYFEWLGATILTLLCIALFVVLLKLGMMVFSPC